MSRTPLSRPDLVITEDDIPFVVRESFAQVSREQSVLIEMPHPATIEWMNVFSTG
jgi:hypothetical protein